MAPFLPIVLVVMTIDVCPARALADTQSPAMCDLLEEAPFKIDDRVMGALQSGIGVTSIGSEEATRWHHLLGGKMAHVATRAKNPNAWYRYQEDGLSVEFIRADKTIFVMGTYFEPGEFPPAMRLEKYYLNRFGVNSLNDNHQYIERDCDTWTIRLDFHNGKMTKAAAISFYVD